MTLAALALALAALALASNPRDLALASSHWPDQMPAPSLKVFPMAALRDEEEELRLTLLL